MKRRFSSNLQGKVRNFNLPKNQPLVPLYEAIVNSINAIDERTQRDPLFKREDGKITIEIVREKTLLPNSENGTILGFKISDNGIGFTDENMASFMEADSLYKERIGGKGIGRFSWLKAFSSVHITSTYRNNDNTFASRDFDFSLDQGTIEDIIKEDTEGTENITSVQLKEYKKEYSEYVPKQSDTIMTRILQHCFIYFLSSSCPEITLLDVENEFILNKVFKDKFSIEENKRIFTVGDKTFTLLNIKINDKVFSNKNTLFICANDRLVDTKNLEKIIVDLDSNIFEKLGYWYLGVLTSDYFNQNVDMNRLSFTIPQERSDLLPNYPSMGEIISAACSLITEYLGDYLDRINKLKMERIQKYTSEMAPQYRHLHHYVRDEIAAIKPGVSDDELDDELYRIKRDLENKTKNECNDLMKNLEKGSISTEEYQKQFQETIQKVSDVNMAALADYVIHRKIILNLLKQGLNIKPDGKFNLEKYLHQLIYPMRSTSDEIPYESHNLWLIDEKLSFSQFISSDKPFNNNSKEDRIDILVLDAPVVMVDSENTGTAYDSITIFELKRPMRDDYNMEENPITQLMDYAEKIKSKKVKDSYQRPIIVSDTTKFYLYAICDITPSLERILNNMPFMRTPDNLGAYLYNANLKAYIEVISYDKLKNDSEKRNKILFDKLGIYN